MQRLYNATSGSEDNWSEPDREVSKSRIGIETDLQLESDNIYKNRLKKNTSIHINHSYSKQFNINSLSLNLFLVLHKQVYLRA